MALVIKKAGLAASIQDGGRQGVHHLGVPECGAMDKLSLALANYLVGKEPGAAGLEFTLTGGCIVFKAGLVFALAGAMADCRLNGHLIPCYQSIIAKSDDVLEISSISRGARLYMAVSAKLQARNVFNSFSTYVPGGFGGHYGRYLVDGDILSTDDCSDQPPIRRIRKRYIPRIKNHIHVRAVAGPEFNLLSKNAQKELFNIPLIASNRGSRMGVEFESPVLAIREGSKMKSSAVFPGVVQCPPSGRAYVLLADSQTTGGYPRIAQIIRADQYKLGQIIVGNSVQLKQCSSDEAALILRKKNKLYTRLFGRNIL